MPEETSQSILSFEHVSLRFDETPALDDVSFEVQPGETRVILGAAGSGKTTLLKCVVGLVRPDSGHIFLFGKDITQMREDELFEPRSRVGMLFQEGGLFDSLTIEENVAYPLLNQPGRHEAVQNVRPRVEESLAVVELEHTLDKFPSELSGGMRRRVGIARANVTEPTLTLYDSPTAGLDPITANTIISLIIRERDTANTTSIVVTHRYQDGHLLANFRIDPKTDQIEDISGRARRVNLHTLFMVMKDGRLVFEGTQAELEACEDPYVSKFVRR
jgi:phospholipid/cholesterol/gamma-HCH transport system ATP-binding protein